ncbi:MAG: hypothetical protein ACOYZ7_08510 [Chloroflexota bacterium]
MKAKTSLSARSCGCILLLAALVLLVPAGLVYLLNPFGADGLDPESGTIYFVTSHSRRDGVTWSLGAIDGGNRQPRTVWETDNRIESIAWSPDRTRLALAMYDGAGTWIYLLDIQAATQGDGSALRRISPPAEGLQTPIADADPAWSPDGSRIAFASKRSQDSASAILVMNADGSNLRRVSFEPGWSQMCTSHIVPNCLQTLFGGDTRPAWSPDGSQIAYVGERRGDDRLRQDGSVKDGGIWSEVHVVNADGSEDRALVAVEPGIGGPLLWTPDGRRILFSETGRIGLFAIDLNGSNSTLFVDNVYGSAPRWSPDGQYLAFEGNHSSIYLVKADGSDKKALPGCVSPTVNDCVLPTWSADGQHIVYWKQYTSESGEDLLEAITLQDSDRTRVLCASAWGNGPLLWLGWAP